MWRLMVRPACDDRGLKWCIYKLRNTWDYRKLAVAWALRRAQPCCTLSLDFQLPELWDNTSLLYLSHSNCVCWWHSSRKWTKSRFLVSEVEIIRVRLHGDICLSLPAPCRQKGTHRNERASASARRKFKSCLQHDPSTWAASPSETQSSHL